jgi:hypothetical protein
MNFAMEASDWLRFVESEYLTSFIHDGGSAIKFAVPMDGAEAATLCGEVHIRATRLGYVVAHVDSGFTRVHMVDQLFFAVAEQIPWRQTVQRVLGRLAEKEGYLLPGPGEEPLFRRMAAANNLDADFLLNELRRKISQRVFGNRELAKDFRVAMTSLAIAELSDPQEAATVFGVLTDWLCGRNKAVSAVKPYNIYGRITRANARYLFESLLVWLAFAGYSGLVLTIDLERVSTKAMKDGRLRYTKAGVLDAYELLRQFIDSTDHLENCLIVVVPHADFLDEDVQGRGIGAYNALKFRVYDEIRDRTTVNPMASLVRIMNSEGGQ